MKSLSEVAAGLVVSTATEPTSDTGLLYILEGEQPIVRAAVCELAGLVQRVGACTFGSGARRQRVRHILSLSFVPDRVLRDSAKAKAGWPNVGYISQI